MTAAGPGEQGRGAGLGYGIALAAFASFLYLALVVCAFGVLSLLLDQDVVPERDAGPILGPVVVAVCVLAVLVSMITLAARPGVSRLVGPSLLTAVVVYALFLLVGGAIYGLGLGEPGAILRFVVDHAATPFAIAAGVLAGAVQILFLAMLARRDAGGGTPHWGWEGDERE
ncbi:MULTISPECIES: DUF6121 family protein [Rathayibacter]|uniref:Uncharacterized protein n=2 Tax=Rathayibacter festucae TaxID=110937 RepID=A0A3T0SWI5_9MICO|nr:MULTISPECIES: DUF6121 family protein [Rathayibacter]AZZ50723.1 hypothetical protein C1I64_00725 [Rathayibacter festucae DSM 15932]MCJ1675110.1 DUF6121 family protein [Rathayibacter sp. VKM Ac-2929]MCJ1681896.1 DUF6121 family protein [Rathayibacter sp. VKM Ac-2928]MCJ1686161.1 DUF6121 family protein [Rathayibacter sp. VKM Ac-2927]QHC63857.1 hypothetical protein GSU69_14995 [Rathayibacter festucae]